MASLPQYDNRSDNRKQELNQRQTDVQYDFTLIPPLPIFKNFRGFPSFKWLIKVAKIALQLQKNTTAFTIKENPNFEGGLVNTFQNNQQIINDNDNDTVKSNERKTDEVKSIVSKMLRGLQLKRISSPGNTLQDYNDIFTTIPLPKIFNNFFEDFLDKDEEFAWMRVAGPNPLVIKKLTAIDPNFPVTEDHYQFTIPGDSLANALTEGRLFITDYAVLAAVEAGMTDGKQKYLYAPLALFALPPDSRNLVPIAIQCGQNPATNPIITPNSGTWAWRIAKTIVQIADANHHELISHLGLTHLLLEVFAIATERQLAKDHPLGILLRAHFEGTFFINDQAQKILTGPGDPVDELLAGTFQASQKLSANAIFGLDFDKNLLPHTFENREVDSLPDYPYRDDALKIWDAIHQWVSDYLSIYYKNDDDVKTDNELQAWLAELLDSTRGKLQGIGEGGQFRTRNYLIKIITQIIFTASAQHAAVNFPQATFMSYAPAMPLAGYTPIPDFTQVVESKHFFDMLPPIKQAQGQLSLNFLLGSVYYTELGQYSKILDMNPEDLAIADALKKFKKELIKIEGEIVQLNGDRGSRRKPYEFLIPSKIPQSVNI